jgi:deoxyribodipyrimidine photo-lyase
MKEELKKKAIFWFRRDLRINDNAGLYYALKECDVVAPVFIFDKNILEDLPSEDKRVEFVWEAINNLKKQLIKIDSDIIIRYGYAEREIIELAQKFKVQVIYANEEYDAKSRQRDGTVTEAAQEIGVEFKLYKDQVIFSKNEIVNAHNEPYLAYSQYKLSWRKKLQEKDVKSYPVMNFYDKFAKFRSDDLMSLEILGFKKTNLSQMKLDISSEGADALLHRFKMKIMPYYKVLREMPFISGVSYLSVYMRFGLISVRSLVSHAKQMSSINNGTKKESCEKWLDQLIWREFYTQLIYNYPHMIYEPFRKEFSDLQWENNFEYFQLWCDGKTGYPLIDAAMHQLNTTGYMHNRLRMVVSCFFAKDLLIDYRMGEQYFSLKLLDCDVFANNNGWQWAASTGSDQNQAIKVFNPMKQSEKFDAEGKFIKKHLPIFKDVPSKYLHEPWLYKKELESFGIKLGENYPERIVVHEERRLLAIKMYEKLTKITK